MIRALAWFLIGLCCAVVAAWALAAMLVSAVAGSGRRGWHLALAFDRLGNVAGGGRGDETFSARCWRRRDTRRYAALVTFIDWIFLRFASEPDHCESAWQNEEAARELACLVRDGE